MVRLGTYCSDDCAMTVDVVTIGMKLTESEKKRKVRSARNLFVCAEAR